MDDFVIRRIDTTEASAHGERLRAVFRDAVRAAAPASYSPAQVVAWAAGADDAGRWAPWLAAGATWIAARPAAPDRPIGFALRYPADHLHLLFVDPVHHRRGIGRALLDAVEAEARDEGVASLAVEASLISYPLFVRAGYVLASWEESEARGQTFRRACLSKALR